jgi:hypothetical protein
MAFDSLCPLITQSMRLERNARVFRNHSGPAVVLANAIADLGELWCRARVVNRLKLMGE